MALQAGMATSRLIVLVGAGLTGSVLIRNGKFSDFISDITKVFTKHLKEEDKDSSDTASLSAQVSRLAQELRQMAGTRNITVVNGAPNQSTNLSTLAVPVVVVGIAGYGYFWWKGWSFSDVMYVTRRNMANVVTSVSKQLEQVTSAVAATKKHLTARIDNVSKTLDDNMEVQGMIRTEVVEIRSDVGRVGEDIGAVQEIVQGLGLQLDEVQSKQDFTNKGIILLCQFAKKWEETNNELPGGSFIPKLKNGESVDNFLEGLPPLPKGGRLDRTSSLGGLKQLQYLSDTLISGKFPSGGADAPTPTLQRTMTPSQNLRPQAAT